MMPRMDDRERLLLRLRDAGQDAEALEKAAADGRLATLAVEAALGGPGRHTLTGVARAAGLSTEFLRAVMRASGRPNPAPRARVLTDEDVELAKLLKRFQDAGLPKEELLEVARVMSQGIASSAEAVRRMVGDAMLKPGDSEYTVGLRYAQAADELAPLVGPLLGLQFRAHLREAVRGQLVTEAEREAGQLAGTRRVAVAFADLVNYTRLGERLPPEDLGRIASRLSGFAIAAVRPPVQLVKMIGDAAMFVSADVDPLLDTILALVESLEAEDEGSFPSLRVGVAYGSATTRGGDWFGATVNVASRVTNAAKPGRILATEEVRDRAPERDWSRKRRRSLKGVDGRLRLYALDRDTGKKDG